MIKAIKLILVTNRQQTPLAEYLKFIQICAKNGITAVQLREKNADNDFLLEFALALKDILDPLNVALMINDNVDLSLKLNCAGVHLGQSDGNVATARAKLGKDKIIGLSIESLEQLQAANLTIELNYVAASSVFSTNNKSNIKTIWDIPGLKTFCQRSVHPVVAIGGIDQNNLAEVMQTGVSGVAVIDAIHKANNPKLAILNLRKVIDKYSDPI